MGQQVSNFADGLSTKLYNTLKLCLKSTNSIGNYIMSRLKV